MFGRTFIGLFLAALSVVGFASTFLFGSRLTKVCQVSPEVLACLRFVIAGTVLLTAGAATRKGRQRLFSLSRRDWLTLAWLGPVGTSLMAWCVFMGCARVSVANASMADALTPLMIFAVAALRTRQITLRQVAGLLCGFVGALLVIQIVTLDAITLSAYSTGDVFVLLAAATWGVYTVYGRDLIVRLGPFAFSTWTMLLGAAAIGAILPFGDFAWPATPEAWLYMVLLGFVSTLLPFWTWNAAQRFLPVSVLGVSAYFTPVAAVALAWIAFAEHATALQWLGTLFIVASAAVETRKVSNS